MRSPKAKEMGKLAPRAPGRRHWLRRLFVRLSFRTKFVVVGFMVAGPLSTLTGFTASQYHEQVKLARGCVDALNKGVLARDLAITLALHRGLTASVLVGNEQASSRLVEQQGHVRRQLDAVLASFDAPHWPALAHADPAAYKREVLALLQLPNATDPGLNFQRHNTVINEALALVYHAGTHGAVSNGNGQTALYDLAFVALPMLAEDLGRQRGWGSAVLTLQAFTPEELNQHLMYAGVVAQRLDFLRIERRGRAQAAQLLADKTSANPLDDALTEAEVASQRSIVQVLERSRVEGAAERHFSEATTAIDQLARVSTRLTALLLDRAHQQIAHAERGRAVAIGLLAALALLLWLVYREFEITTVQRLLRLKEASGRMAQGDFEDTVGVDGSDEISALADALDAMRRRLRAAVAESALALSMRESERARTDFLARWSHDLRTPLNAVLGFARLLGDRGDGHLSGTQRADLAHIQTAGEHLLHLVDDVLDIARREHHDVLLRSDDVDVAAVAADAVDLTMAEAQRAGVHVRQPVLPNPAPWVRADRTRLLQVLTNLVGNAIKFNQPQGWVEVALATEEGQLRIDVSDGGAGIAPEMLPRLFRPFERLDAQARGVAGTGLGLATTKRLVEAMGGRIGVQSIPGERTCFSVWLPLTPTAATTPGSSGLAVLSGRVAYVEDDETNAVLMGAMVEARSRIELVVFASAAQALANSQRFDLWIIDRELPPTDGMALLSQLQAQHGAVRAVMFSANAMPEHRDEALAAGFIEYWTKPMSVDLLEAGLRRLLLAP